jgi:hypothetical protein
MQNTRICCKNQRPLREICWYFSISWHFDLSYWNFQWPIVRTQWHSVQTSVYLLTAVTEVARLLSNCTFLIDCHNYRSRNYNSALPIQGTKYTLFLFRHLKTSILVLFSIPFSPQYQGLNLKKTHRYYKYSSVWQISTDFRFNLLSSSSWWTRMTSNFSFCKNPTHIQLFSNVLSSIHCMNCTHLSQN